MAKIPYDVISSGGLETTGWLIKVSLAGTAYFQGSPGEVGVRSKILGEQMITWSDKLIERAHKTVLDAVAESKANPEKDLHVETVLINEEEYDALWNIVSNYVDQYSDVLSQADRDQEKLLMSTGLYRTTGKAIMEGLRKFLEIQVNEVNAERELATGTDTPKQQEAMVGVIESSVGQDRSEE